MRKLTFILLMGLMTVFCYAQAQETLSERRNVYNIKGDYYSGRNELKKAIVYYNMAYQHDATDLFSVLKKAEVYNRLKLYPQAEECYKIVFDSKYRIENTYRLKYAMVLLANNKPDEFKKWIKAYSQIVDEEVKSENYLVSKEKRIQLYKDTVIALKTPAGGIDSIPFKIKYEGYQFRKKTNAVEEQLFMILENGDEHSINASGTLDFNFSFQPMEEYLLIIQQENINADEVLSNKNLTPEQRKNAFLKPRPIQKDELRLQAGMKYQFSSGKYKIPAEYINTLKGIASNAQKPSANAVDLTALVKELQLNEDGIYTIKFVRAEVDKENPKKFEISTVTMNDRLINIYGQAFVVVLPDRIQENFAIQTDLTVLQKNFNPKKQALVIDQEPLFKNLPVNESSPGLNLTVNTKTKNQVQIDKQLSANTISIIPGTEYILTLSKPNPNKPENIEIIVPLTRGVKYNLSPAQESGADYKKELAEFLTGREGLELANEEVIDISVLSKELELQPDENVSFFLLPVKQFGKSSVNPSVTILTIDGKSYEIGQEDKYSINLPFSLNKFHLQTDLEYIKNNFAANEYMLKLDTTSFLSEITIDTTGLSRLRSTGWLCVSVNTNTIDEVELQDQYTANELSIITGKEYILTVSKTDSKTGKKEEIIIPLLRDIKYDFTSSPDAEQAYENSMKDFMEGRKNIETEDGTVIDITLLSKELKIKEGDEVSFSLLPVKKLSKNPTPETPVKSSLFIDDKVIEFTHIQKYTVNMPLNADRQVNVQTNIDYLKDNFDPASFNIEMDTAEFFSEITIDTTGLGNRIIKESDPVFDVVTVNFNLNEFALSSEANKIITDKVINELKVDNRLYVTIKGYTDALGDPAYNQNLSRKRAESVKDYLRNNGIGESRIRTLSFGASQLINKNLDWKSMSESELRKYRKVEIIIYLPK